MNARVPHLGQRASSHTPISPNTLARVAIVVACSSTTFDQIAVVAFATPAFAYCHQLKGEGAARSFAGS